VTIFLARIAVTERTVFELARRLRAAELDATAGKLEHASAVEARIVALEDHDRHALLRVMEDWCPPTLGDLRSALLQQHVWRRETGL